MGTGTGVGGGGGERTRLAAGVTAAGVAASRNGSGVTNRLGDERARTEDDITGESGDRMKADLALNGRRDGVATGRGVEVRTGREAGTAAGDVSWGDCTADCRESFERGAAELFPRRRLTTAMEYGGVLSGWAACSISLFGRGWWSTSREVFHG